MARSHTTGLSLAIARRGRLVFARAYGSANLGANQALNTAHRLRIASISKSLTAIEIMRLVERGQLRLDQKVLGEGALLGDRYGPASQFADPRAKDITVRELLEHTAGGWDNDEQDGTADPAFLQPQLDRDQLLAWTLRNIPLEHPPGTVFQYSNFGYVLLGRVIEHVTGLPYAEAMRRDVFSPAGATSFALAASGRLPEEAGYVQIGGEPDAAYRLPITTPGRQAAPDGTPSGYAKGWAVNDIPNWWHGGSLPGTSSLLVRTADRYGPSGSEAFAWAAVTNSTDARSGRDLDLDALMWRLVSSIETWPEIDLF